MGSYTRFDAAITSVLQPVANLYRFLRKLLKKTKASLPKAYDEVEAVIKSQLVGYGRDKEFLASPNVDLFTEAIMDNIVERVPNVSRNTLKGIIKDKSSQSFIDLLIKGLGAGYAGESKDYTLFRKGELFKSVLIANRGEIALRVIRACKELGIRSIIIYTKPDKESLAVRFADKAVCIGSPEKYLDIHKIIAIAKKTKADAIHPGYGFLAENAEFADLCAKNKITFIGPTAKTIRMLGDKASARDTMLKAGVPVLSGSKPLASAEEAIAIAKKIGYPVILKAVDGGGGKGMRIARKEDDLAKAYPSATAEAESAFGNSAVYLERYVERPKHIEFQILADNYGNVIHLGERECSIQRRHQKLIEEAPSPAITPELREKMGGIAVNAVAAAGYSGAGTVEFLLDGKNNFFFIEMNTRIQVEHGVTEMVTGVDLVKEQIKIASGASLAYRQEDISIIGHAIECRINAESPYNDFAPDVGQITTYLTPGGPGIRVCSSCHTGAVISPHYDSLIAKLMCAGKTRAEAISRTERALSEFIIEGVETTIPFHRLVLSQPDFRKGNVYTSFIEEKHIIKALKKGRKSHPLIKKELGRKEKLLIITAAASRYLEKRRHVPVAKQSNWMAEARREAAEQEI